MPLSHHIYQTSSDNTYDVAILIKDSCFNVEEIKHYYIDGLVAQGINLDRIIVLSLDYFDSKKPSAKSMTIYLSNLLNVANTLQVKTLLVADTHYFKHLTKVKKTDLHYGAVLDCKIKDYEHLKVIVTLNFASLFYDPSKVTRIDNSITTTADHYKGKLILPGAALIHSEEYPDNNPDIVKEPCKLYDKPVLAVDIETYSLKFEKAKIATISFAWSEHDGIAFPVEYGNIHTIRRKSLKASLRLFFRHYKGKLVFHNATFDIRILIYELWMDDLLDTRGMLKGLHIMYRDTHCTKVLTFLGTNTTAGNVLGLKENSVEFAGNYAVDDIKDITQIPLPELLRYNLVDTLCTFRLFNLHYPTLATTNQESVYNDIYRPSLKTITQMELTGLPMDLKKVTNLERDLDDTLWVYMKRLHTNPIIQDFDLFLQAEAFITKQAKLKVKKVTLEEFDDVAFNPRSNMQVGELLHNHLELPIIDKTAKGAPSVGGATLKKQLNLLISTYNLTDEELE